MLLLRQYLVPFYSRIVQYGLGANNRYNSTGRDLGISYSWDLSTAQINNPIYKFRVILNGSVTEELLLERGGGYTMIVRNDTFTQVDGEENSYSKMWIPKLPNMMAGKHSGT